MRSFVLIAACLSSIVACEPRLPDDLEGLANLMNSNREVTAVAASNKVAKDFGKEGLFSVAHTGGPNARVMAVKLLGGFAGDDVEDELVRLLQSSQDSTFRINVLISLGQTGTRRSLPAIQGLVDNSGSPVARMAAETTDRINARAR